MRAVDKRTLTIGRIIIQLVSSFTGLDSTKLENMLLIVCSKAAESKTVELERPAVQVGARDHTDGRDEKLLGESSTWRQTLRNRQRRRRQIF